LNPLAAGFLFFAGSAFFPEEFWTTLLFQDVQLGQFEG
tara:strand:- start:300 stop:413 length:114 start_codon:yes stop_codon:yes gene_type:complete